MENNIAKSSNLYGQIAELMHKYINKNSSFFAKIAEMCKLDIDKLAETCMMKRKIFDTVPLIIRP